MTERQKDELSSIPIGKMLVVQKELRDVGRVRAAQLLDDYEERLAIIAEGREISPEDISSAWESTLKIKFADLGCGRENRGDQEAQNAPK